MALLIIQISIWLVLAVVLGWVLRGLRFSRQFVEVSDTEMSDLYGQIARLESEDGDLRRQLAAQSERARAAESSLEAQRQTTRNLEQRRADLQAMVDQGDARVEGRVRQLEDAERALKEELERRNDEIKALHSRLGHAETTIKRKTELLRLSETDPAKAAKLSWRPPDSSRSSLPPATPTTPSMPAPASAPPPSVTPSPNLASSFSLTPPPASVTPAPPRRSSTVPPVTSLTPASGIARASSVPPLPPSPRASLRPVTTDPAVLAQRQMSDLQKQLTALRTALGRVQPEAANRPPTLSGPEFGVPDPLQRLFGVDVALEAALHGLGLYYFWQFANWGPEQISYVEQHVAAAKGKARRWSAEVLALPESSSA